jgi:hypothetical protein
MYQGQQVIVSAISNADKVALLRAVNEVISKMEVIDVQYVTVQKEPCVVEYTAIITVKG